MTTDSIKLLPAYIDESTHSYAASDDEAQVVDVGYTEITMEQNGLSNQDGSECPYIRVGTDYYREVNRPQAKEPLVSALSIGRLRPSKPTSERTI